MKRKFEHKTSKWKAETHPDMPSVHYIITSSNSDYIYAVPAWMIEDSEDWIEQKDYKILEYYTKSELIPDNDYALEHKLTSNITKVKRSDGEVFTVRDNYRGHVIEGFQELDNILWVHFKNASYPISTIDKFPKPKKDYEILEVKSNWSDEVYRYDEITLIGNHRIHSVKHLLNDQVFSVGDITKEGTITGFEEYKGSLIVHFCELNKWIHEIQVRKAVLTSEDGVELFDGDESAICSTRTYDITYPYTVDKKRYESGSLPSDIWKYFSTLKAAETYKMNNARLLSYKDVEKEFATAYFEDAMECLKNLIKSRLS